MKKNKLVAVICTVVALALVVTGLVVTVVYNVALKPTEFENIIPVSGEGTGYYRHCYNELNDNEKFLYGVIMQNIYNQPSEMEVPALENGDLTKVYRAISLDNPDLFNLGLKCKLYTKGLKTYFEPEYAMSYEEYKKCLKEAEDIASVIIEGAEAYSSLYEKEKYVHDYIINHCSYIEPTENSSANTIYGCLVEGKASCEGYSRTFQYIMNKLNIDNRLVTGESADDGVNYIRHMWNYIVLDESGYHVDLTWDDPKAQNSILRHTYFNITTEEILLKHRSIEQNIPLSTDTAYNYFVYESLLFKVGAGDLFESAVYSAVHTSVDKGYKCIELRFSDTPTMQQGINTLFNEGVIHGAFKECGILENEDNAQVYYSTDDKMNIICIYF